ncbi:hypothetical protein FPHYL_5285 [Fusarium phyllophilum]|uniref:Heterokaryon incompatibility domain-containing protein n=1 Tax=Fusarium phyllophilum TaxID=47803 RepID=A0A8H5JZ36_9HYPO|nr:hypothetical protein FPHYL_5285 [Fusarium phyllophilum]
MPSNDSNHQPTVGPFTARQVYDNLPLPPSSQCIRVLDVHESDPAHIDRLTGTLRTVDLRTLPKFTALSYVLGQGSSNKIACNGCDIKITQSCYEALTSLRRSCWSLTIWVDAICINQEDSSEKEQQIVLMGSTFTLAETVYVWLGVGNTKTDQAAEYIGAISQFRLSPTEIPLSLRSSRGISRRPLSRRLIEIGRCTLPLAFRNICIEPLIAERYKRDRIEQLSSLPFVSQDVINQLLEQTWLSRAWTFQEMTLASNSVLVCGRQHISWLVMHQALTFIEHSATQALIHPVNGVISETQRQVHDDVSRSDSFKKWQALFDVWQTIPRRSRRSSYWRSTGQDSSCSVHDSVQALGTAKIFGFKRFVRLSLGIYHGVVVFVILFITLFMTSGLYLFVLAFVPIPILYFTDNLTNYSFDCIQGSEARMCSLICHPGLQPQNYLVALAQAIRDRNSKWPHDRVYAIDSVLRQPGASPPTPDYHKPHGRVYRDALVSLMEWNPTFITLLVDCGPRLPDAPSWVPDWSQNNKSWLPDSYIYHGVEKRPLTDQDFVQSVSGNTLSVKAACLGMSFYCLTLEKGEDGGFTSNEMTTNGKLVRNMQLIAEWAMRIRKDTLVFRLHDSIPWTIMLTLTGRSIPHSEITSEQEDTFRRMFEIITQLGIEVDSVPGDTAAAATRALEAIYQSEGCSKLFLDTCNRIAGRRGLIISDNGLIVSGPISIRQGDAITLVKETTATTLGAQTTTTGKSEPQTTTTATLDDQVTTDIITTTAGVESSTTAAAASTFSILGGGGAVDGALLQSLDEEGHVVTGTVAPAAIGGCTGTPGPNTASNYIKCRAIDGKLSCTVPQTVCTRDFFHPFNPLVCETSTSSEVYDKFYYQMSNEQIVYLASNTAKRENFDQTNPDLHSYKFGVNQTTIYTMHFSNTLLLPLTLAAFSSALRTGCRDGEVAVGTWQTCTLGDPRGGPSCGDLHATIYANDCGMISYSRNEGDICDVDGGWPSGYGLRCDNNNPSAQVHSINASFEKLSSCKGATVSCFMEQVNSDIAAASYLGDLRFPADVAAKLDNLLQGQVNTSRQDGDLLDEAC